MTDFEGFTQSNFGANTPTFNTNESHFVEAMNDGESKAIWIPGAHFREDTSNVYSSSKDAGPSVIQTRLLLILTANLVKI